MEPAGEVAMHDSQAACTLRRNVGSPVAPPGAPRELRPRLLPLPMVFGVHAKLCHTCIQDRPLQGQMPFAKKGLGATIFCPRTCSRARVSHHAKRAP